MARRNRNSRSKHSAPGWVWMLFGLTIGLVVAAGVYFRGAVPTPGAASSPAAPAAAKAEAAKPATAAASPRERRATEAARAEPAKPNEPRFDFYEILPQFEVVVPEAETAAAPRPVARSQPVEEPGSYVLQAGSFSAIGDADRVKASLALLGIESRIQRVEIDDEVFHRVRIGPISDLSQLNRVRRQLRDAHVDAMLMKLP
jgi:cell division protein FtsN